MRTELILTALLFAVMFCGCSKTLPSAVSGKGEIKTEFADTLLDDDYLWVRGLAAANPAHQTQTQKRAMSREGAIANAYQRAAEFVAGSMVSANVKVTDAISKDSTLETRIQAVVKNGEIVSTEYTADEGCTVILRIPKKQIQTLKAG